VPLIEIVGRPDLRGTEDARAYVSELRSILVAIGASDGKMEEGSMRVDCNVSVRPVGQEELGTRCEVKNINSLRSLGRAIEYEARRQVDLLTAGERIEQQTRHWNEDEGRTHKLRSKEEAFDYRYFPEPDLMPVEPSEEWIAEIRAALPLLPRERRHRLAEAAGVETSAAALTVDRGLDGLAMATIDLGADAGRVLVHLENNLADGVGLLTDESFAALVALETGGDLTATQAKTVLASLVAEGGDPAAIASAKGFEAMDSGELEAIVDRLISEHPDDWAALTAGDDRERKKKSGFFVGEVMKATRGRADGRAVNELLARRSAG
jgi:aspartyl-tRNA(Asn)/glutamyl-tRNA(Gln) amidotransferase subunit B